MTKFDYEILMLLYEKNMDNPLKAINISQILETENDRKDILRRNRKYNILKERVNMDRKPKPDTYVEPMPQKLFHQLVKQFQELGGKVIMGADAELYLDSREAEACTLNGYTILFRKRPGRAAVYEELFHAAQFRDGKNDGSIRSVYKNEIEAKRQLLVRAKEFQLTEPEIRHTRISLELYERELRKLEKGDTENDSI